MTLDSMTVTYVDLPNTNELEDVAIAKDTKSADRTPISAPLRFIIPQAEKPMFRSAANFSSRQNRSWCRSLICDR